MGRGEKRGEDIAAWAWQISQSRAARADFNWGMQITATEPAEFACAVFDTCMHTYIGRYVHMHSRCRHRAGVMFGGEGGHADCG